MKNNIGLLLTKRASINPEREAYVDSKSGLRLTFQELNSRTNRLANSLVSLGVKHGDRVALALMNSAEFLEAYFAVAKIGGVIVPLNWRLVSDELEFILKDSGSKTLIFGEEFIEVFTELHSRGDKTDIEDFKHGLSWIKELRPVTYRWDNRSDYSDDLSVVPDGTHKKSKLNLGFLAQEELVCYNVSDRQFVDCHIDFPTCLL